MSDEHSPRFTGLMASLCAGMFVFGIVMAILGAILPSLFATIALDKAEAGNLFLVMNLAMLIMSLAFGPVVDRFGFKVLRIDQFDCGNFAKIRTELELERLSTSQLLEIATRIMGMEKAENIEVQIVHIDMIHKTMSLNITTREEELTIRG